MVSSPNCIRGFKVSVMTIVEQLGFVIIYPSHPLVSCWTSRSPRCSGFTSGITRGISFSILKDDALLATANPAFANSGSTVRARSAGSAEKTTSASTAFGSTGTTAIFSTLSGIAVSSRQPAASLYVLPALLSDAARAVISNQGWFASASTNLCPTAPVAPKIPALIATI